MDGSMIHLSVKLNPTVRLLSDSLRDLEVEFIYLDTKLTAIDVSSCSESMEIHGEACPK